MKNLKLFLLLLAISFTTTGVAQTQDSTSTNDLYNMSLEDLMNIELTVASGKKALSVKESPGIITVINEEEIKNSGARDLIDLLRLVAGIDFGLDVTGIIGISMRGNWAHDGKVLLIIDGMEMNELAFSSLQFGGHYSIEQIKQIEVIRGPGSSIYGGFAEYGVINITTKQGKDINGVEITGNYGQMQDDFGHRAVNVSAGKKVGNIEFNIHAYYGNINRSDRDFVDIYEDTYQYSKGNSLITPANINAGISYKNLKTQFIYDDYSLTTVSLYDEGADPYKISFKNMQALALYDWKLNEKLTITPKINFISQQPWLTDQEDAYYHFNVNKYNGNLSASYNINDDINIFAGVEYANIEGKNDDDVFFNDQNTFKFNNISAFSQILINHSIANLTIGGRFDKQKDIESSFSPRIAVTKSINKLHIKALYSYAFRSPGIENMNLAHQFVNESFELTSPSINPEKTNVIEAEIGYQINDKMNISANIFKTQVKQPIVFFFYEDNNGEYFEGYHNESQTGTRGIELEYKVKDRWGYIFTNYSYYSPKGLNEVETYAVLGKDDILLAFANHKFTLNSSFNISGKLKINPTAVVRSKRFSYRSIDEEEVEVLSEEPVSFLANIFIKYEDLFIQNFNAGIGVYDIFGQNDDFIQPYNSWHSPLPGPSREILVKLKYKL